MSSKKELEMAEQQLLGFAHARSGLGVTELASSMGLTAKEWKKLREQTSLNQLDKEELDDLFGVKENL